MQIIGQERIAAPKQQVWDMLYDADVLRRCIPGCQSLTKEGDDSLRVTAEVKIGPIGARFNALVTRTDLDPPHGCVLRIEGHGGTVGFVKSGAKLRLAADPNGGTLLSYDVDAEVGGRLAQLGGPILDATAKQLSLKFFRQLGAALGAPAEAGALVTPIAATERAPERARVPSAAAPHARGLPVAWLLALCVAALVGYLIGHAGRGAHEADWMGLSIGLLVIVVAAAAFEFGRRVAAPIVTLDPALLDRLIETRGPVRERQGAEAGR